MRRLRDELGVLALALSAGLVAGLLATHAVLAAWTYRDAARRDLPRPGRWALAVLVGGLLGFVPYLLVQHATGWAGRTRLYAPLRWVARRYLGGVDDRPAPTDEPSGDAAGEPDDRPAPTGTPDDRSADRRVAAAVERRVRRRRGGGAAVTAARLGWRAASLGARLLVRGLRRAAG